MESKPCVKINSILWTLRCCCMGKPFDSQNIMCGALYSNGIELDPNEHRIFLSGPMSGYEFHNYPIFDQVEAMLDIAGYMVVNPAKIGRKYNPENVDKDKKLYLEMTKEIQDAEKTCNVILLLPEWEDSVGVRLELKTAIDLKMKIVQWRN